MIRVLVDAILASSSKPQHHIKTRSGNISRNRGISISLSESANTSALYLWVIVMNLSHGDHITEPSGLGRYVTTALESHDIGTPRTGLTKGWTCGSHGLHRILCAHYKHRAIDMRRGCADDLEIFMYETKAVFCEVEGW